MRLKLKENPVCSDCIHVVITYDMMDDYGKRQFDIQDEFEGTELELKDYIHDIKVKGAYNIEVIGEPGIYYESKKLKESSFTGREKIARNSRNLREEKYDLSWKEHDVKIRVNGEIGIYPSYAKRIGDLVVNVDPEVFDDGEFGYTVYYTPDMGHAGFKKAESGFMNSSEAMDYADAYIFGTTDWFGSFSENKSRTRQTSLKEQDVEIEVKHEGILEVPEGKNVDDLPISHFEKLAKKKGLGKITKALNNLQVWNKKKNPSLSKWAGDMIDKLTKKFEKNESVLKKRFNEGWSNGDAIITFTHNDDLEADLEEFLFDLFSDNPDVFDFDWSNGDTKLYLACNKDDYNYINWFIEDWKYKHKDEYDESFSSGRTIIESAAEKDLYDDLYSYADQYRMTSRWTKANVEKYLERQKNFRRMSDADFQKVVDKVNNDFKRKKKVKSFPYDSNSYKTESIRRKRLKEDSWDDFVEPTIEKRYIWPLYEDSVYEITEIIKKYQNSNRFRGEIKSFDFKDIEYEDWPALQLELVCSTEAYLLIRKDIELEGLYVDDDEFDESLKLKESNMYDYYDTPDNEYGMFMRNDLPTEEDDWWASIPSDLRAIVHEMEEQGWEGVGFTTTGVEYCISKQDRNRPELSYEMCVTIYDNDNSVSLSKYVDIYDWDKEKEISRIPNSSGISMFRTKEDVRRFVSWFNQLGNSGIAKESVRISRKRKFNESIPKYIKAHTYDQLLKKLKELGFDVSSKSARGVQKDKKIQMYKDGKNYEVKYFINMAQDFALRTSGISEI